MDTPGTIIERINDPLYLSITLQAELSTFRADYKIPPLTSVEDLVHVAANLTHCFNEVMSFMRKDAERAHVDSQDFDIAVLQSEKAMSDIKPSGEDAESPS